MDIKVTNQSIFESTSTFYGTGKDRQQPETRSLQDPQLAQRCQWRWHSNS